MTTVTTKHNPQWGEMTVAEQESFERAHGITRPWPEIIVRRRAADKFDVAALHAERVSCSCGEMTTATTKHNPQWGEMTVAERESFERAHGISR